MKNDLLCRVSLRFRVDKVLDEMATLSPDDVLGMYGESHYLIEGILRDVESALETASKND